METFRSHVTEEILNLTLEIVFLLTGENYGPIKEETSEHSFGGWNSSQNPTIEPPPQTSNDKKILEVTQKIIELLTGEVPIRCQDVSVYLSMEEWEYLGGHRDLYKDVTMEDYQTITSLASSSGGPDSPISSSSNSMNEGGSLPIAAKCPPAKQRNAETSSEEEEHIPYSDISTATDMQDLSLPIMEEHLSCEFLNSVISSPTHHTQSSSKEEALTAEEHLPSSDIFIAALHTQSPSPPITEGSLSAEGHLPHSTISSPADHMQYISIQMMEEQLSSSKVKHVPYIPTATPHGQSTTDSERDPHLAEEHVPHADMPLPTNLAQSTPEGFLSSEHVPPSEISTPPEQMQYISIQIIEGPLSCEVEHLPPPEISTLTQSTPTEIKDEPLSAVEHIPDIAMATHYSQSATPDVKDEPFLAVEHFPHISIAAHHAPPTTTDVKEEVLSTVEHLPHLKISAPTCYTKSTPHVKEEGLSAPEHFPNPDSPTPTHHMYSTPPCVKEEHPSDEEHLPRFDISTHTRRTYSPCTHVKEEPLSCEQKGPSRCNFEPTGSIQNTTSSIKEDSNLCEKGSLTSIKEPPGTESGQRSPPRSSRPTPPPTHMNQRRFVCGECGRCYSIISNLEMHMKTHSGDQLFKCWECGEMFGEASALAGHYSRHAAEKERANATFLRDRAEGGPSSSTRIKKPLPKEQAFSCAMCGGTFSSKYNLNVHVKRHAGAKPYSCPECGKGFTSKYGLNKHCRNYATDKPSSCPEIGRTSNQQADLTRHMIGHPKQKDYCCSGRQKFFLRETTLLKPRLIHPKLPSEEESRPTSVEKDGYDVSHETP